MSAAMPRVTAVLWPAPAALALLGGCASPGQPARPRHAGRLALRTEGEDSRSFTSAFELYGSAREGRLMLNSPLGTTAAQASWSPRGASLQQGASQQDYPDLDRLSLDLLGETLPLAALFDWLDGRPWDGAAARATADGFTQLGWRIDTRGLNDGLLDMRRAEPGPSLSLRVRLERDPS
ncbi:MAG: hypothetical protein RIQ53_1280 [Pseudomonadota bacterium]